MELQQLRYVSALAETRNFTRAAERCFVVQSALSHQIKSLEKELGVALFVRSSRKVELTAAGEAFLPAAREALAAVNRAVSDAHSAGEVLRGTLNVGLIPTVTAVDVPAALTAFRTRHPQVRISLSSSGSDDLAAGITGGELDVAVLGYPDAALPKGVAYEAIAEERHLAVLALEHPLASLDTLSLRSLTREIFVDFPAGQPGRNQSDLAFLAAGIQRDVAFECMSVALMLDLIRQGLAVGLLPEGAVPDRSGMVLLPVTDGPRRTQYLAWKEFNPSLAALAFLSDLRDVPVTPPG